jgi:hypothetical protein
MLTQEYMIRNETGMWRKHVCKFDTDYICIVSSLCYGLLSILVQSNQNCKLYFKKSYDENKHAHFFI